MTTNWSRYPQRLNFSLLIFRSETIDTSDNPSSTSSEIDLGNEKSNDKLLSATGRAGQIYGAHEDEPDKLLWFHKLSWVFYTFAIDVGLSVTIAFWALLRTEFDAFSWHCHAGTRFERF